MRVVITGGCGFVGAFAALELVGHGHEVVCYDRQERLVDLPDRAPAPELAAELALHDGYSWP